MESFPFPRLYQSFVTKTKLGRGNRPGSMAKLVLFFCHRMCFLQSKPVKETQEVEEIKSWIPALVEG